MYESDEGQETSQKVSKYNSGVNIQIRLDKLWSDSHNHCRSGLFKRWNSDLDCIWLELAGDIKYKDNLKDDSKKETKKDIEYNKYKSEFDKFDESLLKFGQFEDNLIDGFQQVSSSQLKNRSQQYKRLIEKALFLKRLEKYLGKGTKWDDEDEDDF